MRLFKVLGAVALLVLATGIARADDTQLNVNGSGHGSPLLQPNETISTDINGNASATFLAGGEILSVTLSLPAADWVGPKVCGASPNFVDQTRSGPIAVGSDLECIYTVGPTDPNEASEEETLGQMQTDCLSTIPSIPNEQDDCVGIPAGGEVTFNVLGATPFATASAQSVISPEPGTFSLLLLGLGGLPLLRRRLHI